MDYESKYKSALEWARGIYPYAVGADKEDLEHYFPELAESEDERIRKVLVDLFKIENFNGYISLNGIRTEDIIAWLEKQGENENKITFTFSDILALECSMKTAKITKGGDELYKILVPLYNKIHNAYLLEKQSEQKSVVDFKAEDWYVSKVDGKIHNIYNPVDKQGQVKENQILQHEGTHEGVSCKENDNSLTREQKPQRFISAEAKEALYDKPAWSEEDEKLLNQVIGEVNYALNDKDMFYNGVSPLIDWLKSLKQRLGK